MIHQSITLDEALARVRTRMGFLETDDTLERETKLWAMEALRRIGASGQYEEVTKVLTVVDYKTKLPFDVAQVIGNVEGYGYKEVRDSITVGFSTGTIELIYKRLPVDAKGFTLVPDEPIVIDAMYWYIAQFLILRDKFPNKRISHKYAQGQWSYFKISARGELNALSTNQHSRIARNMSNPFLSKHEASNNYEGLGSYIIKK